MTDEELDAGLVERLRDALPGTCRKERCRPPLNSGVRCPCADPVLRILGALPIPAAALNAIARGDAVARTPVIARPLDEWHEDFGPALWWFFPLCEPPYVGSPLDDDWPGYHTHWTPIECPSPPATTGVNHDPR